MTRDEDLHQAIEVMFKMIESTNIREDVIKKLRNSCETKGGSGKPSLAPAKPSPKITHTARKHNSVHTRYLAKPVRSIRPVLATHGKTLKNAFSARAIGQEKLTDKEIRSKISEMYNDSKVSNDMILAYILIGVNECKAGVVIVENLNTSENMSIGGNLSTPNCNYSRHIMQNNSCLLYTSDAPDE